MLSLPDQDYIRDLYQEAMVHPVKIDFFTQKPMTMVVPGREPCLYCDAVQALLEDFARLHPAIRLTIHEFHADPAVDKQFGVEQVPATVVRGVLNRPVTFYGLPVGTLVVTLAGLLPLMSQNRSGLEPSVARKMKRLREPVSLRIFVDPSSAYCGAMLTAAFQFGIETKLIHAEGIEVEEFPRLVQRDGVDQVPFTIVDNRAILAGEVDVAVFADFVVRAATTRTLFTPPIAKGSTPLGRGPAPQQENVRPSGLIVPGR